MIQRRFFDYQCVNEPSPHYQHWVLLKSLQTLHASIPSNGFGAAIADKNARNSH